MRVRLERKRLDRIREARMRWCYFILDAGRSVRPKEGGHLRKLIAHCKATPAAIFTAIFTATR